MAPTATSPSPSPSWADPDSLRTSFTLSMSAMYKSEVPLYGALLHIVSAVSAATLASSVDPHILALRHGSSRLDIERHGAIRLSTSHELRTIRRVFAVIGLYPVGYYDLAPAGLPMHATCFRPVDADALARNPFRVFTSVLRPELVHDVEARDLALGLLSERSIFSDELLHLLDLADAQSGRLTESQGQKFIPAAMSTFRWAGTASASAADYQRLAAAHPILADVACFRSAHINHLTPRTLAIAAAQTAMISAGLRVKDRIEGPPVRSCPILLRQTSFLAVEERIHFPAGGEGTHRARFGEIEERGAAVTREGRRLYDELLGEAMVATQRAAVGAMPTALDEQLARAFEKYPDDWTELRNRRLVYFIYRPTRNGIASPLSKRPYVLDELLGEEMVEAIPITYEDFLPLSAAGIFQSNLGAASTDQGLSAAPDVRGMEEALGTGLNDPDELYRDIEKASIAQCAETLGVVIQQ
ncbi:Uncharacterized protein YdcJ [Tolypocladium ophioglossoides CBS 100239]|uniref:2-oxoadipate dioxygenase/decarboxylase n=1 Tax=Tolypocladium ophioglossoides (strain CBS 100239) TaxID=1163406 RepID=A0A0L0N5Y2_TOLOC|nr:Uncharacterized protein YdcJ [Tolypocladium ophioglossoides CBS 100239]